MHNFKIGELALYSSKAIKDMLVTVSSEYMTFHDDKNKTGHLAENELGITKFALIQNLNPLPNNCSWKAIKAEISKPELVHKD